MVERWVGGQANSNDTRPGTRDVTGLQTHEPQPGLCAPRPLHKRLPASGVWSWLEWRVLRTRGGGWQLLPLVEIHLYSPLPTTRVSQLHAPLPGVGETGSHLLQVVKLHRDLPEEEIDVAAPLHRVDKVGLCRKGGGRTQSLT